MKRIILAGLIGILILSACTSHKEEEGKSEIKLVLNGNFKGPSARGANQKSAQETDNFSYHLLLKVSAPDLNPALIFVNQEYQLGSEWTVLVPNGSSRQFDLILYAVENQAESYGSFPFYMYLPESSAQARTYDLDGTPITISMNMVLSPTGAIGSGSPATVGSSKQSENQASFKALLMNTPSGLVQIPVCAFVLKAYLIDPEFSSLLLGPALIDMATASSPGAYYLSNVPVNRNFQLKIVRQELDWQGISDPFNLPQANGFLPVEVIMNGYKSPRIEPSEFLVKDGDTTFEQILKAKQGWQGYNSFSFSTSLPSVSTILQEGATATYKVTGTLYADTIGSVIVYDLCDESSALSSAYWYKAPIISGYSPVPIPTSGTAVTIFGDNFDGTSSIVSLDNAEQSLTSGTMTQLKFNSPALSPGTHTITVLNPRTNPLFPDFNGFSDSIEVLYSDTLALTEVTVVAEVGGGLGHLGGSRQPYNIVYYLLIKVYASDLVPYLTFVKDHYQPGTGVTVLVPNGEDRLFDLVLYAVYEEMVSYNYFNFSLYLPATPESERTYDLTGTPLIVNIMTTPSQIAGVGTIAGDGRIYMNQYGEPVPMENCGYTLNAYLVDSEFPNPLFLGPAWLDMDTEIPGEYQLWGIPVNRNYQVRIERPEMGWNGTSNSFSLSVPGVLSPLNIYLQGWQDFSVNPANFLVRDGDSTFSQNLTVTGGWGAGAYVSHSLLFGATILPQGSAFTYRVTGILFADTVDYISILDACSYTSVYSQAWWYRAPQIDSYYPDPISTGGGIVDIYGSNFDGMGSIILLDGETQSLLYGSTYTLEFNSPPKSEGLHTIRVINPRSNPIFPSFTGFYDQIQASYALY